ncbi:MAG: SpoIIE family protein phosphatase [Acidobacteria bacterium]|nr:SpoIIE family protein phosphatase [Acidobacteriota bacterium]
MSPSEARQELMDRRRRLESVIEAGMAVPQIEHLLREVDSALERVEVGSYGRCETCGDAIEPERLAADPLTRFCLDHLSRDEARALEQDLQLAGRVQRGLLPPRLLVHQGWEIAYEYRPLGPVSGDYCDIVSPPAGDGALLVLFGDVSGKGVAASMLMAHLHATARTLAGLDLPLPQVLDRANRVFCESTMESHYATLVCARLSPSGRVELSNAGHCPPLLLRNGQATPLQAHGVPIGLFCIEEFRVETIDLAPGDALVLYTDGITESVNQDGEPYGEERLTQMLAGWLDQSSSELVAGCVAHARDFRGRSQRADDETVMVIRRI